MTIATSPQVFQLKGNLITITVLHLHSGNKSLLAKQVRSTVSQAPKFFAYAPIILDLNDFPFATEQLDILYIKNILAENKLILVGVRGGNALTEELHQAGLAQFSSKTQMNEASQEKTFQPAKTINQPVRSGQQIYAKESDLIVIASVSHGAEILADGNIHVYGALRGRALAGIMGNKNTQIFCKDLDAELVSIAGHYLVNEQLDIYKNKGPMHIYLENDQLVLSEI